MVISASRRTDLPNYYMEWFRERLQERFVLVCNPFNRRQVSRISLAREDVDCIVFWSKNPEPLLHCLSDLEEYPYYLQFTLNPYGRALEPKLPPVKERIQTFLALSHKLGKRRMVWRYDPILLSSSYPAEYHMEQFDRLAAALADAADECVISFLDEYKNTRRNENILNAQTPSTEEMKQIAAGISQIAAGYGLQVRSCAEETDFSGCGVLPSHCIDAERIRDISGRPVIGRKDPSQRNACGCAKSVDIGMYNTCPNACLYCYANYNPSVIQKNCNLHDVSSPFLAGNSEDGDRISNRR